MTKAAPRVPVARSATVRAAVFVAVLLVDASAMLAKLPSWYGSLPAALGGAQLIDVFAAPLSGGLGAWIGSRRRANGMVEWARSMGAAQSRLVRAEVGFVLLPVWCAHLAVLVAAAGASAARNADFVGPAVWMTHLALQLLAACAFWCCVGWLTAQLIEPVKAVCLGLLLPFVTATAIFFMFPFSWPTDLLVSAGNTFVTTVPAIAPGMAKSVFWGSLAVLAWSMCSLRSRWWGSAAFTAMLSCIVFAALPASQSPVPGSDDAVCESGSGLVVCTPRAYRAVLHSQFTVSRDLVGGLPAGVAPTRIVAPELLEGGPPAGEGALELSAISGSYSPALVLSAPEYTASLGDAVFLQGCERASSSEHGDPPARFDADAAVWRLWWRLSRGLPTRGALYVGDSDPVERSDYAQALRRAQDMMRGDQAQQTARIRNLWAEMRAMCA